MKYLKISEDNPKNPNLDSPAVYWANHEDKVYYFTADPYNGFEYVDLGLPSGTMWAKYNVGATSETDAGLFFQWGDPVGATSDVSDGRLFNWANYKWCDGTESYMTKYNTVEGSGVTDNLTVLDLEDDAAHVNMGGDWLMPSSEQFDELLSTGNTTHTYTTINGVIGMLFTSKQNGNTLFFPYGGARTDNKLNGVGSYCSMLSRDLFIQTSWTPKYAVSTMTVNLETPIEFHSIARVNILRYVGTAVRGVVNKK